MKLMVVAILCLISSFAMADTTDVRTLLIDGTTDYLETNLSTEKTRTEYRRVRVPSTCYRTEYRRRCHTTPPQCRQICDRRGNCRQRCDGAGRTVCRDVPVSVPYSCTRYEDRPYQVHDYYVETNVKFILNVDEALGDASEELRIKMRADRSDLTVKGSKNYFIVLDKSNRYESRGEGVKYVDLTYNISLVPAQNANSALKDGIKNVKYKRGVLTFSLGEGFNLEDFTQNIKVFKNSRLRADRLLLDTKLTDTDLNVQANSGSTDMTVDLNSLGINVPSKVRIILDTEFKIDMNKVLNKDDIKTKATTNWVFR